MGLIVDSHLHVWDETAAGKDPGPMRVGYSAQATASVELFLDYMDEAGVERAVFVQPWFYHWDNAYLARCVQRYPDRFRGVCVVDPRGREGAAGGAGSEERGQDDSDRRGRQRRSDRRRRGGQPCAPGWQRHRPDAGDA